MKYSQSIGIAASLALLVICFLPWTYIASQQITISGFNSAGTDFGKPALFNFFVSVCMLILFAVPAVWSKRVNVFFGALNLAWSFRNYLLVSGCLMGECPEKKPALYLLVGLSILMQLMTLLPKMDIKNQP